MSASLHLIPFTHALGWILVAVIGWRALAPSGRPFWLREKPGIDLLAAFAALTLLQWPFIVSLQEFNADEPHMLAQAMRYFDHSLPWRDADGTTSGPLNSWILMPPLLLGTPLSMVTPRIVRLLLQFAIVTALSLALRRTTGERWFRITMLPVLFFFAWSYEYDFIHYSSELLPLTLLSTATWLMAPSLTNERSSVTRAFLSGLLLGSVPLAKLQAAPMAVVLWLVHALVLEGRPLTQLARRSYSGKLTALVAGAFVVPGAILGAVFGAGFGDDFLLSYFANNLAYMGASGDTAWSTTWRLVTESRSFAIFVASFLVLVGPLLGSLVREKLISTRAAIAGASWVLVSAYCVFAPGFVFSHYLLLLVGALPIAVAIVAGLSGMAATEVTPPVSAPVRLAAPRIVVIAVLAILAAGHHYAESRTVLKHGKRESMRVARALSPAIRPGDEITVWGWMPSLYVDSGCAPATRDSIGHFVIQPGVLQPYYQQRHLGDLVRSQPPVFVDAAVRGTFRWFGWPEDIRHETFPELARFVDSHYQLWREVRSDDPQAPYRIYVSRDRMQSAGLEPLTSEPSPVMD